MNNTREEIREERRELKAQYGQLFDQVAALLFQHDPIEINFRTNTDEYEPEVGTILPQLKACHGTDDVRRVVHQEFVRWFDDDTAGSEMAYDLIAQQIWVLWQKFNDQELDG